MRRWTARASWLYSTVCGRVVETARARGESVSSVAPKRSQTGFQTRRRTTRIRRRTIDRACITGSGKAGHRYDRQSYRGCTHYHHPSSPSRTCQERGDWFVPFVFAVAARMRCLLVSRELFFLLSLRAGQLHYVMASRRCSSPKLCVYCLNTRTALRQKEPRLPSDGYMPL